MWCGGNRNRRQAIVHHIKAADFYRANTCFDDESDRCLLKVRKEVVYWLSGVIIVRQWASVRIKLYVTKVRELTISSQTRDGDVDYIDTPRVQHCTSLNMWEHHFHWYWLPAIQGKRDNLDAQGFQSLKVLLLPPPYFSLRPQTRLPSVKATSKQLLFSSR